MQNYFVDTHDWRVYRMDDDVEVYCKRCAASPDSDGPCGELITDSLSYPDNTIHTDN